MIPSLAGRYESVRQSSLIYEPALPATLAGAINSLVWITGLRKGLQIWALVIFVGFVTFLSSLTCLDSGYLNPVRLQTSDLKIFKKN